jgi:hypothetical protein
LGTIPGCLARAGVRVIVNGEETEFDVVAWGNNILILIEAKCVKSVFDPWSLRAARREIENSKKQLRTRRDRVPHVWHELRRRFDDALPPKCPEPDSIALISISTCFHTSGEHDSEILVTDDMTFERFFSDPSVSKKARYVEGSETLSVVGSVRSSEDLSVPHLLDFLQKSLTVRYFTEHTDISFNAMPLLDDDDAPLYIPQGVFRGSTDNLEKFLRESNSVS